ncbi:MAG TPA: hypothetical protein DIW24_02710 [Bacteroidetes bacterium]|nr:hypothetical protein [Bacteroidota bacterium]HRR09657.1 hypothetical protein [Rhodothermales bacterium]
MTTVSEKCRIDAAKELWPVFWGLVGTKAALLWDELVKAYSEPHRAYHNLVHLQQMLHAIHPYKQVLQDWEGVLLALFYHDVVYDPAASDNEAQSAKWACERLDKLVPPTTLNLCEALILATATHQHHNEETFNLFIGADLAILGSTCPEYLHYAQAIRREYARYPDKHYRDSRMTVLHRFLDRDRIFYAESFFCRYEAIARKNLSQEWAYWKTKSDAIHYKRQFLHNSRLNL